MKNPYTGSAHRGPSLTANGLYGAQWGTLVTGYPWSSDPRPLSQLVTSGYDIRYALTTYLGVSGRESWEGSQSADGFWDGSKMTGVVVGPNVSVRIPQITRGLSNTIMIGERPPGPKLV